ncbi:MAG TPA: YraN family protein [Puia sp.]|nr:YraN family protein [Puia sp.]
MTAHACLGKKGEDLAVEWLGNNGFHVLHRNWRHGRYEIDVIAGREQVLHIVEVKTRRSGLFGPPETSVNRKKFRNVLLASSRWLANYPGHTRVQYDVLSITLQDNGAPEYFLFEDVFL